MYIYPVAKRLHENGENFIVKTNYPEIFADLGCKCIPFEKHPSDYAVVYGQFKSHPTTIYQDIEKVAGLGSLDWCKKWEVKSESIKKLIGQEAGKKRGMFVIKAPYLPFGRKDLFGTELMPDWTVFDELCMKFQSKYFTVQTGNDNIMHKVPQIDCNMVRRTSISDLLDIISMSDMVLTQMGHMIPLCEMLNKKVFVLFSYKALTSKHSFIRRIHPKKYCIKPTSTWAMDNEPVSELKEKLRIHLEQST